MNGPNHPPSTIRRTAGGTARKAGTTRAMSEVEALRQMGDCVRASARKRLSHHAGRTPGPGSSGAMSSGVRRRASWVRMTLDFENIAGPRREDDDESPRSAHPVVALNHSAGGETVMEDQSVKGDNAGLRIFAKDRISRPAGAHVRRKSSRGSFKGFWAPVDGDEYADQSTGGILFGTVVRSDDETTTTDEAPPSPSPSPRPLSAMSRPTSSLSRRSLPLGQPLSSGSVSVGGLAGTSINAPTKTQRPVSLRGTSKGLPSPGVQSAPPSTTIPPEEPIRIFKPLPPNSRSASGSSSISALQGPSKSTARFGGVGRIIVQDGDADATPKAKQQPSSSRPIFVPPVFDLHGGPRSMRKNPQQSNQVGDRQTGSEDTKERRSNAVRPSSAFPWAHPTEDVPIHAAWPVPARTSGGSKFAEMEERLRVMMRDIEQVESKVAEVRDALES
jgi:hypothetical protein